jgi:hypothetical protein
MHIIIVVVIIIGAMALGGLWLPSQLSFNLLYPLWHLTPITTLSTHLAHG